MEKRTKGVYVPMGGKSMITFMDDLNMPAKDTFGSQPPLELLRLWLDYGFWYDRTKQTIKHIKVRTSSVPSPVVVFSRFVSVQTNRLWQPASGCYATFHSHLTGGKMM